MKAKARASEGRFAYEGLDRVIHERARLSVLTSLVTNPRGLTFGDLKQLCSLTDGNLSRHLRVLERGKMVEIVKGIDQQSAADGRADHGVGAEAVSRVSGDAGAGGARRGEGRRRGAGGAGAGIETFAGLGASGQIFL